jgi:hypothetical protein
VSIENRSDGGGGKDGIFMALAIAIVVFFIIRIYTDYVTHPVSPAKTASNTEKAAKPPINIPKDMPIFSSNSPYPLGLEDVNVGMTLSALRDLDLPKGRLYRSVYSFQPANGPFKAVYCMLEAGEQNPQTTSVIYFYRNAKAYALVRQRALDAFGEAEVTNTERGERLAWDHFRGTMVVLEADRYSVEEDIGHDQGDANPRPTTE